MEQIWWWKWNWKRPPVWISSCHVSDDPLSCCHHTLDWCLICNVPPQSDVRWKLSSTGPGPGHGNHDITPQSTATTDPYTLGTYTWPIAELSFIMQTGQLASDIINFSLSAWCRKYSKYSYYMFYSWKQSKLQSQVSPACQGQPPSCCRDLVSKVRQTVCLSLYHLRYDVIMYGTDTIGSFKLIICNILQIYLCCSSQIVH